MAISVGNIRQPYAVLAAKEDKFTMEMTLLAILEAGKDVRAEEQLANSCYITTKTRKLAEADTYYFIKPIIWVGVDSTTLVTMQRSAKYSLHEKVDRFNMSVGHKRVIKLTNPTDQVEKIIEYVEVCNNVSARTSSVMYNKMCSTVFNRECKAKDNNIYKTVYNQQFHTYTNANKQCREVDKQVGIFKTILSFCWDRIKQMQNVFYVVRDQGVFNKAT